MKTRYQIGLMAALVVLVFVAVASRATAAVPPQTTPSGEGLIVYCSPTQEIVVQQNDTTSVYVECVEAAVTSTPAAVPTDTPEPPTPTSTSIPLTPTNTPAPPIDTPEPPQSASPYGAYPNCIAPGVGLEAHSWWHENGETSPRHVHIATCLPNARAVNDGFVMPNGQTAVFRVISFNNPGKIEWVRYQWQGSTQETRPIKQRCQNSPDEFRECTWFFEFVINTAGANGGVDELRISPNVAHTDLGTRQFPTLNFQIRTGNGGAYRNSEEPIARAWYSGLDYGRVQWSNYMDLFGGSYATAVPVVSGIVPIQVRHTKSSGTCLSSEGYIDPTFHAFHAGNGTEPVPFYKVVGSCFEGTQYLDTTTLSNGVHTVYLQTRVGDGRGFNAAAMAYKINVQN